VGGEMTKNKLLKATNELLTRFGNVKLSIAIKKLSTPNLGGRPSWTDDQWGRLFICVQFLIKKMGYSPTTAYRLYGDCAGLTEKTVGRRYNHAKSIYEFLDQPSDKKALEFIDEIAPKLLVAARKYKLTDKMPPKLLSKLG
jgi:hypothetical protein